MISDLGETLKQLLIEKVPVEPVDMDTSLERMGQT